MSEKFVGEKAFKKLMSIVIGSEIFPKEPISDNEVSDLWDNCEMPIGSEEELNLFSFDLNSNSIVLNQFTDNTSTNITVYGAYKKNGKTYKTKIGSNPLNTNMNYMFANKSNIQSIIFEKGIDTSECTAMNHMFYKCTSLNTIKGLEYFNITNVKTIANMFAYCSMMHQIDGIKNWDISNTDYISYIFLDCRSLTSLDLTGWDISNVRELNYLFQNCPKLTEIKVSRSRWIIPGGYYRTDVFKNCGCNSVTYVD